MGGTAVAVAAHDERLHEPARDPLWAESFYLNFSDAAGLSGGFARISLHPGRNVAEGLLCLYLSRGIGVVLITGSCLQPAAAAVRTGALQFDCIEPLRRWRLRYDGEVSVFADPAELPAATAPGARQEPTTRVSVDLEATGLHAPFFYPDYRRVPTGPPHAGHRRGGFTGALRRAARRPGEIVLALRMRAARHYEQSMTVRGAISVDGQAMRFDGTGHRDHSWGLRDFGALPRMRWLSGQLDGLAFNAVYLTIAGSHVTNGYVYADGRAAPVDEVTLRNTFDGTGLAARTVELTLTASGERHVITGDVLLNVPLPITGKGFSTIYTVGWTRYRCGDRTGYGVAEFLERLDP